MKVIRFAPISGPAEYYSSLSAVWFYNDIELIGATLNAVRHKGLPFRNNHCLISQHEIRRIPQKANQDKVLNQINNHKKQTTMKTSNSNLIQFLSDRDIKNIEAEGLLFINVDDLTQAVAGFKTYEQADAFARDYGYELAYCGKEDEDGPMTYSSPVREETTFSGIKTIASPDQPLGNDNYVVAVPPISDSCLVEGLKSLGDNSVPIAINKVTRLGYTKSLLLECEDEEVDKKAGKKIIWYIIVNLIPRGAYMSYLDGYDWVICFQQGQTIDETNVHTFEWKDIDGKPAQFIAGLPHRAD